MINQWYKFLLSEQHNRSVMYSPGIVEKIKEFEVYYNTVITEMPATINVSS